jgi:hypothetical protein
LSLPPDVDVYLVAGEKEQQPTENKKNKKPVCRDHFLSDACPNRRCKWSHELTIAGAKALSGSGGSSGGGGPAAVEESVSYTTMGETAFRDLDPTLPPLTLLPGFGVRPVAFSRRFGLPAGGGSAGHFERLPEAMTSNELCEWVGADCDFGALGLTCRFLRLAVMLKSQHVAERKAKALPRLRLERHKWLCKKANAARIRSCVRGCRSCAVCVSSCVCVSPSVRCHV